MKLRIGARRSTIQRDIGYPEKIKGNCYFCHKEVDGMFYCWGCQKFVCEDCENSDLNRPCGNHRVEDHKE